MANSNKVRIDLEINSKTGEISVVQKEFTKLGTIIQTAETYTDRFNKRISEMAHAGVAIYSVKQSYDALLVPIKEIIAISSGFENQKSILKVLEGDSQKAEKSFEWIKNFSLDFGQDIEDVGQAFLTAKNYGIDPTLGSLESYGDAATSMKKSTIDAVEAVADAMVGENERLKEFGIKTKVLNDEIAYSWTSTSGKAKHIVVENNSEIIQSTLDAIFNSKYQGAMKAQVDTWDGAVKAYRTTYSLFIDDIGESSGVFDMAKLGISEITKNIKNLMSNNQNMESLGTVMREAFLLGLKGAQRFTLALTGGVYVIETIGMTIEQLVNNGVLGFATLEKAWKGTIAAFTSSANNSLPDFAKDILGIDEQSVKDAQRDLEEARKKIADIKVDIYKRENQHYEFVDGLNLINKTIDDGITSLENYTAAVDKNTKAKDKNKKSDFGEDGTYKGKDTKLEDQFKSQASYLKQSDQAWQTYYEKTGQYSEAWFYEEAKLMEKFFDLPEDKYQEVIALLKTEYFDKIKNNTKDTLGEALTLIESPIDSVNNKFLDMYELIKNTPEFDFGTENLEKFFKKWQKSIEDVSKESEKYEGIGSKDWTAGLDGTAKNIANIGNAIADLGKEQEAWTEKQKEHKELGTSLSQIEEDKNTHLQNQLGLYINVAGAVVNMAAEGSAAAKVAQVAQTALAVANGAVAIMNQGSGDPYTAFARIATMTALVASTLSSFGISGGGGSGGGMSQQAIAEQNIANIEANYQPVTDRLDRQIELLESIDRNGSAAQLGVEAASTTFQRDMALLVQEVYGNATNSAYARYAFKDGWSFEGLTNAFKSFEDILGFNVAFTTADAVTVDWQSLLQDNNFIKFLDASKEFPDLGSWTGFIFDKGWSESGLTPGEYGLQQREIIISDFQELVSEFALSLIDTVTELEDASSDFKEYFDNITGTTTYETARLKQAYKDIDAIRGGKSLADYLQGEITKIDELSHYLTEEAFNTLLSQDSSLLTEQIAILDDLKAKGIDVFESGSAEALDYIESIELVTESMSKSRENITSFIDSYKTDYDRLIEKAFYLGVGISTSNEDLKEVFETLQSGLGGLTDEELEFLDLNKEYIESLNDQNTAIVTVTDTLNEELDTLNKRLALYDTSSSNIESFTRSFLDQEQLTQRLANQVGSVVSPTMEELLANFQMLASDADGLTNKELELINTNKAYLESLDDTNDKINDFTSDISSLERALGSIGNVIDTLSAEVYGGEYILSQFYTSMNDTIALATSGDAQAFAESLDKTIGYSSSLLEASNFTSDADMRYAQAVALNQFKSLEDTTLDSLDYAEMQVGYLEEIAENTKNTVDVLVLQVQTIADSILASNASVSSSIQDQIANTQAQIDQISSSSADSSDNTTDTNWQQSTGDTNPFVDQWVDNGSGYDVWKSSGGATGVVDNTIAVEDRTANDIDILTTAGVQTTVAGVQEYINGLIASIEWKPWDATDSATASVIGLIISKAIEHGISANSLDAIMGWGSGDANSVAQRFGFAAFANGGVVDQPTVALFGEAGAEAFVPLPDGKNIPVNINHDYGSNVFKEMKDEIKALRKELSLFKTENAKYSKQTANNTKTSRFEVIS